MKRSSNEGHSYIRREKRPKPIEAFFYKSKSCKKLPKRETSVRYKSAEYTNDGTLKPQKDLVYKVLIDEIGIKRCAKHCCAPKLNLWTENL